MMPFGRMIESFGQLSIKPTHQDAPGKDRPASFLVIGEQPRPSNQGADNRGPTLAEGKVERLDLSIRRKEDS
jgi:hypothetical protein